MVSKNNYITDFNTMFFCFTAQILYRYFLRQALLTVSRLAATRGISFTLHHKEIRGGLTTSVHSRMELWYSFLKTLYNSQNSKTTVIFHLHIVVCVNIVYYGMWGASIIIFIIAAL